MTAAIHPLAAATPDVRDVLALESYADRLTRHRHQLEDDLQAARQRIAWHRHERGVRRALAPGEIRTLTAAGILAAEPGDHAERSTIERRADQLAALAHLEQLTRDAIDRLDHAAALRERRSEDS